MITIQFELNKNSLLKKRNIKGSTEHSKETTESQRLSTVVQGEEKKKQWLHSYNFILVTLEKSIWREMFSKIRLDMSVREFY